MTALNLLLSTEKPFLTDGGLETELIFHDHLDLPLFSAFVLLFTAEGRDALRRYFNRFLDLAETTGRGFVLDTATWRANMGWAGALGLAEADIREANRLGAELAQDLRGARSWADRIVVNGCIGPGGDGYSAAQRFTPEAASDLHAPQIEALARGKVDMVTALTLTHTGEAIGILRRAAVVGLPAAISFTVELDGRLPSGQSLSDAIAEVDDATGGTAVYYGINCAHPTHFLDRLRGAWLGRIGVVRANASAKSHAELDVATVLDDGDPLEFGVLCADLSRRLPGLKVIGGCCGTDHRHVSAAASLT